MQHNVPSSGDTDESRQSPASADAHLMRVDAPQVSRLWRLADKFRVGADRIDDLAADARRLHADRLLWKLADRLRGVAERVDDLAADVAIGRKARWAL